MKLTHKLGESIWTFSGKVRKRAWTVIGKQSLPHAEKVRKIFLLEWQINISGVFEWKVGQLSVLQPQPPRSYHGNVKSRDITLLTQVHIAEAMVFCSSPVQMWELDHKEDWVLTNWCFWTVVLEKILESPLDCKEIQPVHPKEDHSWVFIGRTDVEAETPILWTPDAESWLIWKDPDAGKHWRLEERGMTEDEMVGWHHRLSGHGFG